MSFNEIYTNYYRRSFQFVKSYLHDSQIAEDIVSESLISLWEQMKIVKIENLQFYLFRILKNKILDHLKHEAIERKAKQKITEKLQQELNLRISLLESCDPKELLSEEIMQIYLRTLNTLPEKTRMIFNMSRVSGKSNKEIARFYGITVKGVDYHISIAIKEFKIALRDYLPLFLFVFYGI